jgi:hypothetical protein
MEFDPTESTLSSGEYWATVSILCLAGLFLIVNAVGQMVGLDVLTQYSDYTGMASGLAMALFGMLKLSTR